MVLLYSLGLRRSAAVFALGCPGLLALLLFGCFIFLFLHFGRYLAGHVEKRMRQVRLIALTLTILKAGPPRHAAMEIVQ